VKPGTFVYERPETLEEALVLRGEHGDGSAVLAGGQSLLPMLNFRLARPEVVIDLGGTARETAYVRVGDGVVAVGAMTRQRDLELDASARRANPLIEEALKLVAHSVVRNRGTVVGSVAHGDASAELPTLLVTLDGEVTASGPRGTRTIRASDLYTFHLTTTLEPDEVLSEVRLPALAPGSGYGFVEYARRHGDFALCGVCATVELAGDGTIETARIGYAGVSASPTRSSQAERVLAGARPREEVFAAAGAAAADGFPELSERGGTSPEYRRHLIRRLTARVLALAAARAETREASA
jgi:aerobic carbon-monoxide dehydrogenase medium subunit